MKLKTFLRKIRSHYNCYILVINNDEPVDFNSKSSIPDYFLNMEVEDHYEIGDFETDSGKGLLINIVD